MEILCRVHATFCYTVVKLKIKLTFPRHHEESEQKQRREQVSFDYFIDVGSRISGASYLQIEIVKLWKVQVPTCHITGPTAFNKQLSVAAGCYVNVKVRRKCVKLKFF